MDGFSFSPSPDGHGFTTGSLPRICHHVPAGLGLCLSWIHWHPVQPMHYMVQWSLDLPKSLTSIFLPPAKLSTFSVEGSNMVKSSYLSCWWSPHFRVAPNTAGTKGVNWANIEAKWLTYHPRNGYHLSVFSCFFRLCLKKTGPLFGPPKFQRIPTVAAPLEMGPCLHRLGAFGSFSLARATVRLRLPEACNPRRGAVGFVGWTSGWIQWYSYIDRIMIG